MRLREHRGDRGGDPPRGIEGGHDYADTHASSVRIGSRTKG
jgi:hypothetical protein